jgi:hypothetical protein
MVFVYLLVSKALSIIQVVDIQLMFMATLTCILFWMLFIFIGSLDPTSHPLAKIILIILDH